jgi:hypothetical protein
MRLQVALDIVLPVCALLLLYKVIGMVHCTRQLTLPAKHVSAHFCTAQQVCVAWVKLQ